MNDTVLHGLPAWQEFPLHRCTAKSRPPPCRTRESLASSIHPTQSDLSYAQSCSADHHQHILEAPTSCTASLDRQQEILGLPLAATVSGLCIAIILNIYCYGLEVFFVRKGLILLIPSTTTTTVMTTMIAMTMLMPMMVVAKKNAAKAITLPTHTHS